MSILANTPTKPTEKLHKKKLIKQTEILAQEIGEIQHLLYAESKKSLLVVLQGVDASGKDGSVKNVFKYCNPTGIDVYGFKKPSEEEFAHDFLWRVHKVAPRKGNIMVFNRSHYEDILIQRVHGWITEEHVHKRMKAINAFEELLEFDNQTTVLKFYLHISKDQQEKNLQERIDDPAKRWKHNENDWEERKHWEKYMECYEYVLNESLIPWHIIPADKAYYRNYQIAQIVLQALRDMKPALPV